MPATSADLLNLLHTKQYKGALSFMQSHPDSLNGQYNNQSTIFQRLLADAKNADAMELIQWMVSEPGFDFYHRVTADDDTNLGSIFISKHSATILPFLKADDDRLVFVAGTKDLTFTLFKGELDIAKRPARRDPLTVGVSFLRDRAILYAINKDDSALIIRLQQAGANPVEKLSDGRFPRSLVKDGSKIDKWFDGNLDRSFSRTDIPSTLYSKAKAAEALQAKVEEVENKHAGNEVSILGSQAKELGALHSRDTTVVRL